MSATERRTFSLIRTGLRALQERDAAVDRWLREDVVPVAAALRADPARALPADEVFGEIRALHARRRKGVGRGA